MIKQYKFWCQDVSQPCWSTFIPHTRPDIVHVIHEVCQKIQQLTIRDYKAIKRIIRYIKGILNFELHFIQ